MHRIKNPSQDSISNPYFKNQFVGDGILDVPKNKFSRSCIEICNFFLFITVVGGDKLNEQIILALISFAGTLIGSLAGICATSKLSNYRIEQLEKKVDKHNNLIERVYLIEQHEAVNDNKIKTAEHRIADLENEQNKERKI